MVWFALVSVAIVATLGALASVTTLDHDEIVTLVIARLPSIADVWAAHLDGLDLTPPLNNLVAHGIARMGGEGLLAARAPQLAGYWLASACVFEIVRRRSDVLTATAAVLLLFASDASVFATQARGYALMLGLFSLALFAWSEAAAGRRRSLYLPVLSLAIAAGVWNHYYAMLVLVPLAAGEAVRVSRSRTVDRSLWLAIAAGAAAMLPLLPLARAALDQSATFWSRLGLRDVPRVYEFALGRLAEGRWLIVGALVAAIVLVGLRRGTSRVRLGPRVPAHELAAGASMALIPAIGVAVAVVAGGAFVPRYAITASVGLAIVVPLAVWRLGPRGGFAESILCAALVLAFSQSAFRAVVAVARGPGHPIAGRATLGGSLDGWDRHVVTGTLFLTVWHHASSEQRGRLLYVADPAAAARISGTDTIDRGYQALARWSDAPIAAYEAFVATRQSFRLYTQGEFEWLPQQLAADGARLTELGREGHSTLYQVAWDGP